MRRKLDRLLRFKTEEFQTEDRKDTSKRNSGILSGKNTNQSKQENDQKEYFINTAIKPTSTCKMSTKSTFRNKFLRKINTQQNFSLNIEDQKGNRTFKDLGQKRKHNLQIFKQQIKTIGQQQLKIVVNLERLLLLGQKLVEQIYCYGKVQSLLKSLNSILKQIGSKSLKFKGYCLSAQSFYVYGSYSLSIFYFDKALKILGEKQSIFPPERQNQIDVYRTIANIFLIKNQFNTAKQFAYKYLRMAWHLNNLQEELNAYDLLGKIYHELEQKDMSSYFHNKMCKGERQTKQIIKISNYELEKQERQTREFAVYETVEVFINSTKIFHEMLEDRYRMKNRNFTLEITNLGGQFFFHTHRSPNRNLNTYRILERKMIVQKSSKQLHFIKPKQTGTLKKLISTFVKLITDLRDEYLQEKQNFQEIEEVISVFKRY